MAGGSAGEVTERFALSAFGRQALGVGYVAVAAAARRWPISSDGVTPYAKPPYTIAAFPPVLISFAVSTPALRRLRKRLFLFLRFFSREFWIPAFLQVPLPIPTPRDLTLLAKVTPNLPSRWQIALPNVWLEAVTTDLLADTSSPSLVNLLQMLIRKPASCLSTTAELWSAISAETSSTKTVGWMQG